MATGVLIIYGITAAIVLLALLGLRKGRIARLVAGAILFGFAIYFILLTGQTIWAGYDSAAIYLGGTAFISSVLGIGFLSGKLKGKNEKVKQTS